MELKTVIGETFGMMGFTFLVGMGVALLIKLLTSAFRFFGKDHLAVFISDYKKRIISDRKRRADMRKLLALVEKESNLEMIKYIYENKNNHDVKEEVDDIYDLFKFYRGIYKDKKENDGIDNLIRYYHGEV